ncbi:Crp/Fnr family transcriptional regulator [Wenyingzhuangia aestuarii]|uniref:Crp/Fnr family transcriptional regulator n=1 Tax=Wenyingzhuangia aestuarii TaxID=1647582 RepID=UPI0014399F93|nr:Crp/Fnr family transcriptional regulator [Wenyingzhuangia aestuarii]NJB82557.1 CRP/FNR family transcriptional regulator [Wenyingzhuangia aestuarii]
MLTELELHYSYIFEKELLEEISRVGTIKEVPAGTTIMNIGQYIKSMPLLIDGAIKILREDDDGDELLLYFLEKGDTCAMTMSCCTGNKKSEIKAVAELDTKLVMIPIDKMDEWIGTYKSWRNFVLDSYHNRLMELLETVDNIAFKKMDERLLKYLKDKVAVTGTKLIKSTHQEIAYELHTSRVVISRLLKKLETNKVLVLNRNSLELL